MKYEITVSAKTVELAVEEGAEKLGKKADEVSYDVIEAPKKGFLGIGETDAKVNVYYERTPNDAALEFVKQIIRDMDIYADAEIKPVEGSKKEYIMTISGEDSSVLIGHHGETLDSLQYLVNLAANRRSEDDDPNYTRITLDIEDYRAKREQTLRRLAKRTAERALRMGRNITLEPMSPYERRIIHSEIQNMKGVTTNSIGSDSNRRVMIIVENAKPQKKKNGYGTSKPAPVVESYEFDDIDDENYTPSTTIGPITKRARFDDSLPEYHLGDAYTEDEKTPSESEKEEDSSENN